MCSERSFVHTEDRQCQHVEDNSRLKSEQESHAEEVNREGRGLSPYPRRLVQSRRVFCFQIERHLSQWKAWSCPSCNRGPP